MSFAKMKQNRNNSLSKLTEELGKINSPQVGVDERFWKPELDKSGNGYAVIRFLPAPEGEDLPWVRVFNHGFQGPGGWYIENSLTTLNKKDPVGEYNSKLWATGIEANRDIVRKQKRRLTYISNIMVMEDSKHPENVGKVFLYKYGKRIFDKVNDMMNPSFEDEDPINPFDFWEGANFKLKIRKVEGFTNYDKSEFASPEPLLEGNDDELEALWKKEYSLQEFLNPENFKTFEELQSRLNKVLGQGVDPSMQRAETDSIPAAKQDPFIAPPTEDNLDQGMVEEDGEENLAYFAKLANEG